jgi:DNA invertase Pin-like site-specific DNA recombinase
MVGAVIYVRVSTKEQTENLSLPTQLRACEEYCRRQGYEILERFHEEGESAKSTDRSQLQNLLTFCRLNKGRVHFVVVFNLTRFARDKYDHFALRSHLQSLGISLRSATEPIDDTSTGKLMEGVLAAFAQFDNDVRSDRTRAGMKAALELGRWVFLAPIGYLNAPRSMGKSLIQDPVRAPLVRRAFEQYATGRFTKEQLLKTARTLGLTNRRGKPLTSQAIGVLLRNQLYAGIVDVPEYGVRYESHARRPVRRRTRATPANPWLHALAQGIRAADLESSQGRCARGDREGGASREDHPREARPLGRGIPFRALNRYRDVRPPCREAARGVDARADRPTLRPARRTRRGRHPGLRRTDSAARVRPVGPGITRPVPAVPTTVPSRRNRVRWKSDRRGSTEPRAWTEVRKFKKRTSGSE